MGIVIPKMFFKELIVKKILNDLPNCKDLYQFKYRYNFAIYVGNLDVVKYIVQLGGKEMSCSQNVRLRIGFHKNYLQIRILNFKTTCSEFQIPSQTASAEAKPRCVYSISKPHGQSFRNPNCCFQQYSITSPCGFRIE